MLSEYKILVTLGTVTRMDRMGDFRGHVRCCFSIGILFTSVCPLCETSLSFRGMIRACVCVCTWQRFWFSIFIYIQQKLYIKVCICLGRFCSSLKKDVVFSLQSQRNLLRSLYSPWSWHMHSYMYVLKESYYIQLTFCLTIHIRDISPGSELPKAGAYPVYTWNLVHGRKSLIISKRSGRVGSLIVPHSASSVSFHLTVHNTEYKRELKRNHLCCDQVTWSAGIQPQIGRYCIRARKQPRTRTE